MSEMPRCVWCGAPTRFYDAVCPRCGKKLETTPPPIELPDFGAPRSGAPPEIDRSLDAPTDSLEKTARETRPREATNEEPAARNFRKRFSPRAAARSAASFVRRFFNERREDCRAFNEKRVNSVVVPPSSWRLYLLWFVAEIFVCFPCAVWGARCFLRALWKESAGDFTEAMRCAEQGRRVFFVGLAIFAAALCAFVYYVGASDPYSLVFPTPSDDPFDD